MNKLTRSNLQEFCRTCLSNLKSQRTDEELSYNIYLLPNLRKLMIFFTSLDLTIESDDFPKSLCQLCYDKILNFQDFRQLALRSAEFLCSILNDEDESASNIQFNHKDNINQVIEQNDFNLSKNYYNDNCNDDDDQLLLPELIPLFKKPIKTEPNNTELESALENSNSPVHNNFEQNYKIKTEIDSEYEEENSTFYENNALGTTYDTIGDDADDEEHALRNGAANTSSALLNTSSASSRQYNSKRDRNKKSLKCPRCDKQVYKQVYLDAHIRGVHEGHEKPFLCAECQKAFTRYNQLHIHIQSNHILQQKFICGFNGCEATFKMVTTLETHQKVVHTSSSTSLTDSIQEVLELHQAQLNKEIEMDHTCNQCLRKYSSKRALTEHLKRHAQIKEHVCKTCGVAKVTRTELQTHMRTHEPNLEKFKCTICPQEFNHKNAISRHVRVVHEGERRFQCSFCAKKFGTRRSQICHERLHTGEKPFSCDICNKSFAQLEGLKSHMKNHDKNLRKHVCSFCSQRFITRKNLVDHENRHRGEKPHICSICSRGFFNSDDLLTHQRTHLEESNEEQFMNNINNDYKETNLRTNQSSQSSIKFTNEINASGNISLENKDDNLSCQQRQRFKREKNKQKGIKYGYPPMKFNVNMDYESSQSSN